MRNRVREIRQQKNMTIAMLHERSGVAMSFISEVETGKAVPSIVIAYKIARGLGVPVTEAFPEHEVAKTA